MKEHREFMAKARDKGTTPSQLSSAINDQVARLKTSGHPDLIRAGNELGEQHKKFKLQASQKANDASKAARTGTRDTGGMSNKDAAAYHVRQAGHHSSTVSSSPAIQQLHANASKAHRDAAGLYQ